MTRTVVYRLITEFPASGGCVTSFTFHSVKLLRFIGSYDLLVFMAECVYFGQVLW